MENIFDTIVCSAFEDTFTERFLLQNLWWAIQVDKNKLENLKHVAIYRTEPISAITHVGDITKIELMPDESGKYIFHLNNIKEINPYIEKEANSYLYPQKPKYTSINKILKKRTLSEIF